MRIILCTAILAILCQGCIITAPFTIAWRSNSTQQVADTDGSNKKAADTNTVNADKQTDISASIPQSKSSTNAKKVVEEAVEKAAEKTAGDNACP